MSKPAFIITIDTEGDNLWQNDERILTENTRYLPRFQALCEQYGFKPTWLTNYEMASDPAYVEFARDVIARNQGEVGMHLHAWNSPPLFALTDNDWHYKPYLIEYPEAVMREKIAYMTSLLEDTFQVPMHSHRAGRWAMNADYARLLVEFGYRVDCSVTPRVNWQTAPGAPNGEGGTDYRHFPRQAYFMDIHHIDQPGDSALLEVPMSIQYKHHAVINGLKQAFGALAGKKRSPSVHWLRPKRNNLAQMKMVVEKTLAEGSDYVEFMLHSSEFMPGGSPTFTDEAQIEALYDDLTALFAWLSERTEGKTLYEYYQSVKVAKA
ncbi:polysaccharide deacetylase family protein [Dickeya lacustris]|uniref:Polysaccharide deacetylase family protein n=1 Tax=Dickeya lacustris TaxID=2259638 RepID=A0ABY8G2J0_9GAMM|nr:polysaccharide deacetylase family protein [Dickeya lacustris]WFN54158.1 polysaccharide deacetylase family protein [Dickeya lacustris]